MGAPLGVARLPASQNRKKLVISPHVAGMRPLDGDLTVWPRASELMTMFLFGDTPVQSQFKASGKVKVWVGFSEHVSRQWYASVGCIQNNHCNLLYMDNNPLGWA